MAGNSIVLSTPNGKLRGSFQKNSEGADYYAFKGIPYAKPPIGPLRFCDPEPVEPWTEVRDATAHGPISPQYDMESKKVKGSENCLYANVYTRSIETDKRAPVMVWIHGGAFVAGNGNDDEFGPDFFLRKDVVLVTFNYRLGVLGFLNLEHEVAPGNQGLKDQVMILQWVKTQISYFGGDPDNVTIFGGSAGAASVHYLSMSPLAKGLFHKAICQSGTALNPWASQTEPKNRLHKFLEFLGFEETDPNAIVTFLKTIDYKKLIEMQTKLQKPKFRLQLSHPFGPGVDDKSPKPFLPENVSIAAERGVQVPFMMGLNSMEGLIVLNILNQVNLNDVDNNFEEYTYGELTERLKKQNMTITDLKKFYLKNDKISEHTLENTAKLYSDISFVDHIHELAKIQVRSSSAATYFYKLSYDKNITFYKKMLNSQIKGACHGDELTYLFKSKLCDTFNLDQFQEGSGADRVMKHMVELWTNFAKTGRPTLTTSELVPCYWLPLASDKIIRYLNIDEDLRMENMLSFHQTLPIT